MVLVLSLILSSLFGCSSFNRELSGEQIFDKISESTVEITAGLDEISSLGSGFFIDTKGTVVTNYHVIEGCSKADITSYDGGTYKVTELLGFSKELDIAILATTKKNSKPVEISPDPITTGEKVYALGSSLGLTGTFSEGIVSAAEREVSGTVYIQITTPISSGNSGGPLVNSKGEVVGITSAGFDGGQNLNLAIPISTLEQVSCEMPMTMEEFYQESLNTEDSNVGGDSVEKTVTTMSNWDFFYYDDDDAYALIFELTDDHRNKMICDGAVEIKIINSDGVTVYHNQHNFTSDNYWEWTRGDTVMADMVSLFITPSDITPSTAAEGKVYFTVWGEDYYFEETVLTVYDLPIKPVTIELPELPTTVTDSWAYGMWTQTRIDKITYKVVNGDSLYIYFAGEKIYDYSGNNSTSSCTFGWKLYDTEGYLIDSGTVYTDSLSVGDKFKDEEAYVWDGIKPGQTYKLVLVNSD